MKTKHSAQTDGHVRVSGEVIVDLEGIAYRPQPGQADGAFLIGQVKGSVSDYN